MVVTQPEKHLTAMTGSTRPWKKRFILIFGLFENLIFTGTILGWSALNYMLKAEGVYRHLCVISPEVEYVKIPSPTATQFVPETSSIVYDNEIFNSTFLSADQEPSSVSYFSVQ